MSLLSNYCSHLRKADLTVLKETKIAEQEENVGRYFSPVMSSVNQNLNFQVLFAALFGLWRFDWLASARCLRIINSSQNSLFPAEKQLT